jgi:hypothetical protein
MSEKWVEVAARLKFKDNISWTNLPTALEKETGYNFNPAKIRAALRRHPDYKADKGFVYENKKTCDEQDWDTVFGKLLELQEAVQKVDLKQTKVTIQIPEYKPIAIAHWGDWHFGAEGVDYKLFQKDSQMIQEVDGLYFFGMGDYKDNYITGTHAGGNFGQLFQPGMQDELVKHEMVKVGDKALALLRGCHDTWDKKGADKDFIATLCELTEAVNLWHGGEVTIKLGEQTYIWRLRHKYPFQSSLNIENSMRRIMELQGPCDVAAEAHLHNPYTLKRHLMGSYRVMLRSGSYKVWDEYCQQLGGYKGKPGVPVVIIYPDRHEMHDILELERAADYITTLRSKTII